MRVESIGDIVLTASGRVGRLMFGLLALVLLGLWTGWHFYLTPVLPSALSLLAGSALLYLGTCLMNQRLHDIGRAGWWTGLVLAILMIVWCILSDHHLTIWLSLSLAIIVLMSLLPGDRGHNRYGPPPPFNGLAPRARPTSQGQKSSGRPI